ncbi:hypothetical protein [Priestia megaterium]|uniref:hypothetical protein n=1 Tax=Priestia megaterium TaxID=1404 RepID=UPI000D51C119|nr:hypothetical protein [Priestia megaterium]PVE74496.1 hypothetical protein DC428_00885 [Priestia megaterium]PVE82431.1 hypothetical protein DC421_20075 [Priestia megaterium]PVE87017.1 hypothetical protein DC426_17080 [Priestia megaterium]PVE94548.1 hypothetical protein DC433_24225 [Priestia megaterium]
MSYYEKKYIKGDHKKHDCKEDYKEDCKKDDHKYDDYHEEENGLLTEFDVDQAPTVPVSFTGVPSTASQFAEVEVCVDDHDDRVALDATIDWQPASLSLVGLILAILAALTAGSTLPLGISATFRIWRRGSSGTVLISEKTDTSPLSGLTVGPTAVLGPTILLFGETTTSIHAVDTNPPLGENEYFLTISAAPVVAGTVIPTALVGGVFTFSPFVPTISPSNVISYTFTASEIEENE